MIQFILTIKTNSDALNAQMDHETRVRDAIPETEERGYFFVRGRGPKK